MLKHLIALVFLSFPFGFSSSAQSNSLLWKIEAPHLSKPSYLYGTMHSRDKRAHQFGDSVMAKLNGCDAVALELLISKTKENPFALLQLMMMEDTTLDMLLSEEDYQLVKEHVEEHLPLFSAFVNKMKPIFTSAMLSEGFMRNDKPYTVDEYFEKKAGDGGKHLIGIETVEEQMGALGAIKLEEQAKLLVEQIKSGDSDVEVFEELMEAYVNQDLDAMMKIYKSEEIPEMFDEALVVKRNQVMAHRMDSIVRMQPTFNAVGALHLAGSEGVVELLRKKGYKMTPVVSTYSGKDEPEIYFPHEWMQYTSKKGKFTMDFPAMPEEKEISESLEMSVMYADQEAKVSFLAMYSVFSKEELKNGDSDYDVGIEQMQQKFDMVQKTPITYMGLPAMDCEFKVVPGINIRYRFLLVKNRMYMFGVGGSSEFINSPEADKFYNSLKFN